MYINRRNAWGGAALLALAASSCLSMSDPGERDCLERPGKDCHAAVRVCHHPSMVTLAGDLDRLEKHIETYGSATAKVPDVWGQSRLQKYREEFEKEFSSDTTKKFEERLQGYETRLDQSFFANAMALSMAISGPAAVRSYPAGTVIQNSNQSPPSRLEPVDPGDPNNLLPNTGQPSFSTNTFNAASAFGQFASYQPGNLASYLSP